jgi:hypothetical protein
VKIYSLFFLSLLIGISNCYCQNFESTLWEISGNGLSKKSYLFGTIHTASIDVLTKFPKLNNLIHEVDLGLFEINGKPIGNNSIVNTNFKDIPQPPLDSIFTPEEYLMVDSFFSATPLGSIRPHNADASLIGMLQVAITYKNNSGTQYISLDSYINKLMDSLKKDVYQLDDLNDKSKSTFQSKNRLIAETLVAAINKANGTISKDSSFFLYEDSLKSNLRLKEKVDQFTGDVTIERNKIWLPKIIEKIRNHSCFIAVGLGHLQYDTGIISLLRRKGYILKPVKLSQLSK